MLRNGLGDWPVKRPVRSQRAGAIKTEYLFGGALAVIIIGAMVLAIWLGFLSKPSKEVREGWQFFCDSCQKEFIVEHLPPKTPGQIGPPKIDCPLCGAKQTGVQMVECPKCETNFVPESHRHPEKMFGPEPVKDVCPECGLDLRKHREDVRKRLRRERNK